MPTINCTEFSRQLAEAVERRKSVDTVALREHAASCHECCGQWLDALLVDRAVADWKKPVAAAGLTDRILSHVAAETGAAAAGSSLERKIVAASAGDDRPPSRPTRGLNRTAGAALSAIALCVCALLFLGRPAPQSNVGQSSTPHVDVVKKTSPIAARDATTGTASMVKLTSAPEDGARVELMVADAGSAYLHLAGKAAKAVTAATLLLPPADAVRDTRPTPKGQEPWVDGVRREIAPVTHQLSHAFEFLIQAVPEKRAPAT
ncbi:MAG TPA: hypothetical protein VEI07_04490 [Planctomycetaceae bacterium]|nr:hypothetical protein [Planctomycetaceae bacterium]